MVRMWQLTCIMTTEQSNEPTGKQQASGASGLPWLRASVFLIVLFAVIFPFTSAPERLKDYAKEVIQAQREADRVVMAEDEQEGEVHVVPEPQLKLEVAPVVVRPKTDVEVYIPMEHFEGTKGDMVRMSQGFQFDYQLETIKGELASEEREDKQSYVAEYKLKVKLPKASTSVEELEKVNENIGEILPGLESLLETAKVSDFYYTLYENKVKRLERDALNLSKLLTKHNFYDCETMLNLTHKKSGQRMLLVQGDMDVVSDGSDGDRLPTMPEKIVNSTHYQPFTSYGWRKTGETANPMIAGWQQRVKNAELEIAQAGTTEDRKQWLKNRMQYLKRGIDDMKRRSFLVAEYDPFIVMPVNVLRSRDAHAASPGDYAVVIFGDTLYPAIVGDGGPDFKVGEGSLRMAKELNSRASSYSRPVSDLTVTYLVFAGSREDPKSAPDYTKWHQRCSELLEGIGGIGEGYELHQWEDLLAPKVEEVATEIELDEAGQPVEVVAPMGE